MPQAQSFLGFHSLGQLAGSGVTPKYERLREFIMAQIQAGHLQAGQALLSEHQIARSLRLARSTVRQAMTLLERDGLVKRIHGRGTYIHEEAMQRLHRGQNLLALLLPESEMEFYPAFQKHFAAAATAQHHQLVVCNSTVSPRELVSTMERLIRLDVSGVAFVPPSNSSLILRSLRTLRERQIPVVCCYRPVADSEIPVLSLPFEEIGRMAGELISRRGHRRVLFCAADQPDTEAWTERGFRAGMGPGAEVTTLRLHFSARRAFHCEAAVSREVDRLFGNGQSPTAIFCTFDPLAELFYLVLSKKGLRVPEEVSLVGFGGLQRTGALAQRLTSIAIDESQFGSLSVQQLRRACHSLLARQPREKPLLLRVHLFAGRTLAEPVR